MIPIWGWILLGGGTLLVGFAIGALITALYIGKGLRG